MIAMIDKPPPRLPLNNAEELFEKLKWEEARLLDGWGIYDSFNFVVTAYHLYYDWIKCGKAATQSQSDRAKSLTQEPLDLFQAVADLANGSKHFILDHKGAKDRQVVTEVTDLTCAGWDSYIFGDMVHIKFGIYFLSMSEMSALVMKYLEWIIEGGSDKPPIELSQSLAAMRI
jgi:hypothetical protein